MGQCLIVRLDGDAGQMFADLWRCLFLIHKQNHVILGNVAIGEEERVEGNVRTAHIEEPANFVCEVEIEINLKNVHTQHGDNKPGAVFLLNFNANRGQLVLPRLTGRFNAHNLELIGGSCRTIRPATVDRVVDC